MKIKEFSKLLIESLNKKGFSDRKKIDENETKFYYYNDFSAFNMNYRGDVFDIFGKTVWIRIPLVSNFFIELCICLYDKIDMGPCFSVDVDSATVGIFLVNSNDRNGWNSIAVYGLNTNDVKKITPKTKKFTDMIRYTRGYSRLRHYRCSQELIDKIGEVVNDSEEFLSHCADISQEIDSEDKRTKKIKIFKEKLKPCFKEKFGINFKIR